MPIIRRKTQLVHFLKPLNLNNTVIEITIEYRGVQSTDLVWRVDRFNPRFSRIIPHHRQFQGHISKEVVICYLCFCNFRILVYLHGDQNQSCYNADIGYKVQPRIDLGHIHVDSFDCYTWLRGEDPV